jgi:hypothetical protein
MARGSLILISRQQDFFKYGIYQSFVSNHSGSTPTQIVYYDEIRRGSSVEEVDLNINPNLKVID